MSPAQIDIVADRNVPYQEDFAFLEQDYTGSTAFKMQLRSVRDTTGPPLDTFTGGEGIALDYAGTDTVSAHVAAGRLLGAGDGNIYTITNPNTGNPYQPTDSLALSLVGLGLNIEAISTVPIPEEVGTDAVVFYDIIRTPATGADELIMRGQFTVRAGVTIS